MKRLVPVVLGFVTVLISSSALAQGPGAAQKPRSEPAVVDSVALLERAVAADSSNFENLYRLGVMYLDRDRVTDAARVLIRASRLRPDDIKTMVNVGAAYDALGQGTIAQNWYDKALAIAPGDSVALCRKASSIYGQGRYAEAMDVLRDLVRARPRAYCAYFTMGVAFADAGLYRDAIRMWRKVSEIAPSSPEAVSARESIEVLEKFLQQPAR